MRRFLTWGLPALLLLVLAGACLHGLSGGHGPEPGYADHQGGRVYYLDTGGGGAPLVLVHGWACDTSFWKGQVGPMSASRRVIALDLPGHGRSGPSDAGYAQDSLARAVLAVMDHAGVERAVLVGHSMGASVVRRLALAAPERVAALVLVDGALLFPPDGASAEAAWRTQMQAFVDGFRGPDGEARVAGFVDSLHGPETPEALRPWVKEKMLSTPRAVRLSAMAGMADPGVWRGGPVGAPTLAVYAASETLPPDVEASLGTMFPDLEYALWDGPGHFLQLERPARLNALIFEFLTKRDI